MEHLPAHVPVTAGELAVAGGPDGALLRLLTPADAPGLLDLELRNRAAFERVSPPRDERWYVVDARRSAIERSLEQPDEHWWGVFAPGEDGPVGSIRLSSIVRGAWQNGNLGYSIDEAHWGRGLATFAVEGVVRRAFGVLRMHRVQAAVLPDNAPSARVLEKCGFREEGFAPSYLFLAGAWRDHRIFARTAADT